jgi:hypothetical protein
MGRDKTRKNKIEIMEKPTILRVANNVIGHIGKPFLIPKRIEEGRLTCCLVGWSLGDLGS